MEAFVKGDVVVIDYPYTDLAGSKKRRALVVATPTQTEAVLCQITSQPYDDKYAIALHEEDFSKGTLHKTSVARTHILFTAKKSIIKYKAGSLQKEKQLIIQQTVKQLF